MDEQLHKQLLDYTQELRSLLSNFSTEEIVGSCASYSLRRYNLPRENNAEAQQENLSSPFKQQFHLLGLMLTSQEPENPPPFEREHWLYALELLNRITHVYSMMFWPTNTEEPKLNNNWKKARDVAMPSFLHYFNTGMLASIEQIRDRVAKYISPFDRILESTLGLGSANALAVTDWIAVQLQDTLDQLFSARSEEYNLRMSHIEKAALRGWNDVRLRYELEKSGYPKIAKKIVSSMENLMKVSKEALRERFGQEVAESYWNLFVSSRKTPLSYQYITENNPAEDRPLFEIADGVAMTPIINAVYYAILKVYEKQLLAETHKDAFLNRRDRTLEQETERLFREFLDDSAEYYANVYETNQLQYEHDLIIRHGNTLLVIEAKSTPPTEPFRDPDKAYIRIKHAFQGTKGVQKAYEQSNRIRSRLASNQDVTVYNERRAALATFSTNNIQEIFCICVTRDDYGALAVDLSLLLDKALDDPYPWAVNILDLENLLFGWKHLGWGMDKLLEYLRERIQLHGKLFSTDELEIAGFFIKHGSLQWLINAKVDNIFITPDYADVFDEMYFAEKSGEKVYYEPTEPFIGDLRQMLREHAKKRKRQAKRKIKRRNK